MPLDNHGMDLRQLQRLNLILLVYLPLRRQDVALVEHQVGHHPQEESQEDAVHPRHHQIRKLLALEEDQVGHLQDHLQLLLQEVRVEHQLDRHQHHLEVKVVEDQQGHQQRPLQEMDEDGAQVEDHPHHQVEEVLLQHQEGVDHQYVEVEDQEVDQLDPEVHNLQSQK